MTTTTGIIPFNVQMCTVDLEYSSPIGIIPLVHKLVVFFVSVLTMRALLFEGTLIFGVPSNTT